MDPPSPTKLAMSPGMPIFPISPERAAGIKPLYGEPAPDSPSTPTLRSHSPLRNAHRRNDSDVSVQGLAVMFENLEVKDPREASLRFKAALEKEKAKNAEKVTKLEKELAKREKEHELAINRRNVRIEELQSDLETTKGDLQVGVSKAQYEKERKAHKANVAQWEKVFKQNEDKWRNTQANLTESSVHSKAYEGKYREYKKRWMEANKENLKISSMIPTLQTKIQSLQRNAQRAESDTKFKSEEAARYQNQLYSLQIELEGVNARTSEEIVTLNDKLKLIEGERDALKTSLKEEEVMRIAAEGHIALPAAANDEDDEFGSPIRSPRKPRPISRCEDDKENVAPRKGAVELRFLQQELAAEKRLRQRAEEQVDFMKMECQFQCCSCRIAENQGKQYVHDNSYATEMQRIKMSVPATTPPPSSHGEDPAEDVRPKQEPIEDLRPCTPRPETPVNHQHEMDLTGQMRDSAALDDSQADDEAIITFSPSTGTFRAIPSPAKATASAIISTSAMLASVSAAPDVTNQSSPWAPDAQSTMIATEPISLPAFQPKSGTQSIQRDVHGKKAVPINIHEDEAVESDEEDIEPPSPTQAPTGPATPYLTRTITTTTTIPMHFSPATPALKPGRGPMTPSTVAHAPADGRAPALSELSLNNVPFDREAALEAIRQRRGRARSMAAGQGTPMKQMVQGAKDRRDISAPVSRVRR